jgi:hypothetical protein
MGLANGIHCHCPLEISLQANSASRLRNLECSSARKDLKKRTWRFSREQSVREIADPVKQFCAAGGVGIALLLRQQSSGISNVSRARRPRLGKMRHLCKPLAPKHVQLLSGISPKGESRDEKEHHGWSCNLGDRQRGACLCRRRFL